MQTQTSNTLHNAIMEAGGKDLPPMLALGNYVQWKSRIKRYIDTKPNHELIHYCLMNPPYKFTWADKVVPVSEGSPEQTTIRYMETYKNVSQDIRDQLNAKAEAVQIILTWIDNDIYSTVSACPNAFYHPQNHPTHYTQNSSTRSQQAATRDRGKAIVKSPQPIYDQEPSMVAKDDETSKDKEIDKIMALISLSFKKIYKPTNNNLRTSSNTSRGNQENSPRINRGAGYDNQRECQKPKRVKDAVYHREKMLLCKQEEAGIQLNAERANWRDDIDDESEDQELEAHYIEHPEQSESILDTYSIEQDEHNMIIDSLNMSYDKEQIDQNDDDYDLANERGLLASLIEKLKCEINDSKNHNKFLETSNKKSQAELERRNDVEYASKVEIDCAKSKGDLISYKMESQNSFNKYTQTINDLNQTISKMKKKLSAHQETISILSQQIEAQIKLYKTHKYKELDKVIALENKVKVLENIGYKTGQLVQTINMLNSKYRTSFEKPEFLKKAQRVNPLLYDIEEMVANLRYFNSLELEVDSLKSQLEAHQTQFLNEIDRLSREYYYADYMNAILALQKHAINLEIDLQQCKEKITNDKSFKENQSKEFRKEREHLNAKTSNVNFVCAICGKCVLNDKHDIYVLKSLDGVNSRTKMPIIVPVSTRELKCTVNQSVAKPLRKTVASESNQKPRNSTRKLYERISKACSWWYLKFTPSGYNWKPKSKIGNGNDLLTGSRGKNLYSITLQDTTSPNPICLMAKATSSQAWLWHRRLSHMNFDTINFLSKNDIVIGLPKLKFIKDNLCSSCELGKAKRKSFQTKTTLSSKTRLQLLHMDLYGPMRVASINGKKYVLVIVDDYSRYTWTHFLSFKDETPEVLIDFLRRVQRGLHAQVRIV
nr:retrovirus-related Pol polyprotein from transposon TNT 1-94 [Tanacetum cinerariifolium]